MRAKLVRAIAFSITAAALLPATALAGSFTRPVRLPGTGGGWLFALNDRGQALATDGNLIYPVERSGRLGHPWKVTVPGGFKAYLGSLALDDRGRVAAGLIYSDESVPPGEGEYGSPGCCARVAVASWKLGTKPPVAQLLVPPTDQNRWSNGELDAPSVVIGPEAVTALWGAGDVSPTGYPPYPDAQPFAAQLDEAFGPFGAALEAKTMMSVSKGVQSVHLVLDPAGDPLAAWRDDLGELHSVRGRPGGALPSASQATIISRGGAAESDSEFADGNEFSSDPQGDTVFAYIPSPFEKKGKVMAMTSVDGRPFGAPRTIASAGRQHGPPTVVAGGNRSLLVFTNCLAMVGECSLERGRRTNIFGVHERPFGVGGASQAFIDSRGRSVIAFEGDSAIEAITAEPRSPFGHRRRISPAGRYCRLGTGDEDEPPPASSPNGAAIFYYQCGEADDEYLVRYTP